MPARLLYGAPLAGKILARAGKAASVLSAARGFPPRLEIVAFSPDRGQGIYIGRLVAAGKLCGVSVGSRLLAGKSMDAAVRRLLERLSGDPAVDGILLSQPLPPTLDGIRVGQSLSPDKDVEGMTAGNYGRLFSAKSLGEIKGARAFIPTTAAALLALLRRTRVPLRGAHAVLVGRSRIVGRPMAHLLSCLDATVTLCHSKTRGLDRHIRRADIVVAALGKPRFIRGTSLKPGAVVLDAGTNRFHGGVVGDVDFESAVRIAGWITPVPGGAGPVTTAMLLANVVLAAGRRSG